MTTEDEIDLDKLIDLAKEFEALTDIAFKFIATGVPNKFHTTEIHEAFVDRETLKSRLEKLLST